MLDLGVNVCSVTEIPSAIESEMQQNLQCLLSTACLADSVHDVVFQVHEFTTSYHDDCGRKLSRL